MSDNPLGVQYDKAHIMGSLDYRRPFGGVGGTGTRSIIKYELDLMFSPSQDDPLLLALVDKIRKNAEEEAVRYYANHISALGDF